MYLTLGKETVIPENTVLGVFDLDTSTQSPISREFLSQAEKKGQVINTAEDLPISFFLCEDRKKTLVFLSQSSSRTVYRKSKETSSHTNG